MNLLHYQVITAILICTERQELQYLKRIVPWLVDWFNSAVLR